MIKTKYKKMPWYQGELLDMAKDLGYRLLPAFNTTTGIPYGRVRSVFCFRSRVCEIPTPERDHRYHYRRANVSALGELEIRYQTRIYGIDARHVYGVRGHYDTRDGGLVAVDGRPDIRSERVQVLPRSA